MNKIKGLREVVCLKPLRMSWVVLAMAFFILQQEYVSGGSDMEISSSAFKDGEKIPVQYVMPGAGGKNISVPLSWKNPPSGTKSFALSMVDPHPVAQNWVHWLGIKELLWRHGLWRASTPQGYRGPSLCVYPPCPEGGEA